MNNREAKIKFLSRINREKTATPAMVIGLCKALGTRVEEGALIDPSLADKLMGYFRACYVNAIESGALSYMWFFHQNELPLVHNLAEGLALGLKAEEIYLLTKYNGDDRGVVLNASVLFSRVAQVLEVNGDSLNALSKDQSEGVLIDHNLDDSEQACELTVWGDRWPLLILARDQVVR